MQFVAIRDFIGERPGDRALPWAPQWPEEQTPPAQAAILFPGNLQVPVATPLEHCNTEVRNPKSLLDT